MKSSYTKFHLIMLEILLQEATNNKVPFLPYLKILSCGGLSFDIINDDVDLSMDIKAHKI